MAKKLAPVNLGVTMTGNTLNQIPTHLYEVSLLDSTGSIIRFKAYGLDEITGKVSPLDIDLLKRLFPGIAVDKCRRGSHVDILIGCELAGLHPRRIVASAGPHLSVLEGPLGWCVQGSHPELISDSVRMHHCRISKTREVDLSSSVQCYYLKSDRVEGFIQGEELGMEVAVKCGGCKCNKCPSPGHTYSFREEQELELIRSNLKYDRENKRWITKYPWLVDPRTLPNNYQSALSTQRFL
jgi:hypothetical protein